MSNDSRPPEDPQQNALFQMALSQMNRHKCRMLSNLEEIDLPELSYSEHKKIIDLVKAGLDYQRKDILDLIGGNC